MPIIRAEKKKDYTVMRNRHLRDRNLILKARGLLSLMLSMPDDWVFSVHGLKVYCREGSDSIRNAIRELEEQGYLRRIQKRSGLGCFTELEWEIHEIPGEAEAENPGMGNPDEEKPDPEAPDAGRATLLSTESIKY